MSIFGNLDARDDKVSSKENIVVFTKSLYCMELTVIAISKRRGERFVDLPSFGIEPRKQCRGG